MVEVNISSFQKLRMMYGRAEAQLMHSATRSKSIVFDLYLSIHHYLTNTCDSGVPYESRRRSQCVSVPHSITNTCDSCVPYESRRRSQFVSVPHELTDTCDSG